MKFNLILIQLVVLSLAIQTLSIESNGNNSSMGVSLGRKITPFKVTPECDATSSDRQQCSKDCSTVIVCDTVNTDPLATMPCSSSLPYCDKGECVKSKPSGCAVDLNCPGEDYFYPDLNDCYKYFYCDDSGDATESYQCPLYFPFDFKTQTCNSVACGVINCYGKTVATNPNWPNLGVFCKDNKPLEATYIACNENYELDDSLKCKPKCRKTVSFPNYEDATNQEYYYCLPSGPYGTYQLFKSKCPGTKTFDPATSKCK